MKTNTDIFPTFSVSTPFIVVMGISGLLCILLGAVLSDFTVSIVGAVLTMLFILFYYTSLPQYIYTGFIARYKGFFTQQKGRRRQA